MNIAEPMPPTPRRASSCQYVCERPARALERETMPMPTARIIRSPTRLTSQPAGGEKTNRIKAKAETTALAANAGDLKLLGEQRNRGKHDAEPDRDCERNCGEDSDLAGEVSEVAPEWVHGHKRSSWHLRTIGVPLRADCAVSGSHEGRTRRAGLGRG